MAGAFGSDLPPGRLPERVGKGIFVIIISRCGGNSFLCSTRGLLRQVGFGQLLTTAMICVGGVLAVAEFEAQVGYQLVCCWLSQMDSIREKIAVIKTSILKMEDRVMVHIIDSKLPAHDTKLSIEGVDALSDLSGPQPGADARDGYCIGQGFSCEDQLLVLLGRVSYRGAGGDVIAVVPATPGRCD